VQQQIREYYDYVWSCNCNGDEDALVQDLPVSLKENLNLAIHSQTLEKVPLFQGLDRPALVHLIRQLVRAIFLPGDYIYEQVWLSAVPHSCIPRRRRLKLEVNLKLLA
jgi:hypothetical protein